MASPQSLPITCPKCGHKFSKPLAGLKAKPEFPCPKCGQGFDARQLIREFEKVEQARGNLAREIRKKFGDRG